MPTQPKLKFVAPRGMRLLAVGLLAVAALGPCGCTTSLSDWVHNCFKVGPNYVPPPAPVPDHWIDEHDTRVHVGAVNLACWWDVFGDPILSELLHRSVAGNLTVRQAGVQILQAKIQKNIACSELLPQAQDFLAQYTHGEVSRNNGVAAGIGPTFGTGLNPPPSLFGLQSPTTPIAGTAGLVTPLTTAGTVTNGVGNEIIGLTAGNGGGVPPDNGRFFNNVATSVNLAWEIDFWGLFRRNLEAASASLDQSVDNYDELVVLLLANVATQYVEIRTLQRRLELARQNVAQQEPLVERYRQRWKAGSPNSEPGYFQLKSNLDNTRALIPPLEEALRQANNQLCVLLGLPVHDMICELGDGTITDPADSSKRMVRIPRPVDDSVVVGIPGEILLHRPDVLAAEQQLKVQSAQIGIAEAEMYPHLGIGGSIGLAASRLGLLFNQQSWTGNIGPSLTWNILNYGRLLANVHFQNEQYKQFVLVYQQAILNANQDAENSLVAYLQSIEQARYLTDSANAAVRTSTYILRQDKEGFLPPGAADTGAFINQLFTILNFQVTQQDAAAQAEGNIALNLVLLYRAMGGGWQNFHPGPDGCPPPNAGAPAVPAATTPPAPDTPEKLPPPKPVEELPPPKVEPEKKAAEE